MATPKSPGQDDTKEVFVQDQSSATNYDSGNETSSSASDHVFSDPKVADHWRQVYENAKYENRHRFDPSFSWDLEEERRLVKKVCTIPWLY